MDRDEQPRIGGPPTGDTALTTVVYDGRQLVIHADGTTTVLDEMPALQPVAPRILPGPSLVEPDPIGRDDLVERVFELLRVHTSVQLWGPPGIGRRTVAHAAIRRFGAGAPTTTVYAHGQGLGELVQNIFEALFYTVAYRPAVDEVRDLVSETQAWIVVEDCELDSYDVSQLVEIFPQCVFALVSPEETLRHGVAVAVPPLSEDDGFHLAQTWIGPLGLDMSIGIVREACRQAAGIPQRLAMYAAFLQAVATRPNTPIPPPIPPFAQATVLLAGLTGSAREVLIALVALDAEGDGASLTALAGLPRAADIGTELLASGLVTRVGVRLRPTVDAVAVLTRAPERWDPALAADRMRVLMGPAADPAASPRLLLAVVRAAVAVRADGPAALLVRESAPWLLAACQIEVWAKQHRNNFLICSNPIPTWKTF